MGKDSSASRVELDAAERQHDDAVALHRQDLAGAVGEELDRRDPVARAQRAVAEDAADLEPRDMGVRHQEQPPVEVALLRRAAARPALRVADRRDQQREAAELVRREDARDEGLGLHRDRRRLGVAERRAAVLAQGRKRRLQALAERGVEADAVRRLLRPEDRIEDEVVRGMDADLELDSLVDGLLVRRRKPVRKVAAEVGRPVQVGADLLRPLLQVRIAQAGTPAAPVDRLAADAVGGAGKADVAAPADPPHEIAGALGVGPEGVGHRAERVAEPEVGDVLAVLVDEKRPGLEHEDAQRRPARLRALAVDLRSSVAAVHARPDHHHVEVGIGGRLVIGAADEAPEDIEREGCPLDVRLARRKRLAGRLKLGQGHCHAPSLIRLGYDPRAGDVQGQAFPTHENTSRRFETDVLLAVLSADRRATVVEQVQLRKDSTAWYFRSVEQA